MREKIMIKARKCSSIRDKAWDGWCQSNAIRLVGSERNRDAAATAAAWENALFVLLIADKTATNY